MLKSKQKNRHYFYSEEEDKLIVDSVRADFLKRREDRRAFELSWELNLNFYLGNQYTYISSASKLSDIQKQFYWENHEVFNHIAPIIESRLAKLSKVKPSLAVKPSSASDADRYSAKLSDMILSKFSSEGTLAPLISTANFWSEITGTAFYKLTWDSSLGNLVGQENGVDIKNGDAVVSVCSPFEIYPDFNGSIEVEDCASIIEARALPVEKVLETWGIAIEGEDIDIFELESSASISNIAGKSNISKVAHQKKHDHALVLERYEKPSAKHPNGRLTIVCKDALLYDGALPYNYKENGGRAYPFVRQLSIKRPACFWGQSVIERLIPLQRAYNAIKNKKHEFISRLASGVLSVEDGSVDIDNLEENGLAPGKILVYRNGSTPPKFLDAGSVPGELEREEESLLTEMNNLASVSEVTTNSDIPKNVTSATAISLLVEQDDSRLAGSAENIRQAIKELGIKILLLYKQFAGDARLGKFLDDSGTLEIFYFSGKDISSDNIVLEGANELEEPLSDKKALLLSLYDKGLLSDENGVVSSAVKSKILSLMGMKNWNYYTDTRQLHRERANKENLGLIELAQPLEIDDHQIHIDEHTRFVISDEVQGKDKCKITSLLEHIKAHEQMLKNKV